MFLKRKMNDSTNSYSDKILQIKEKISQADAVIIGAGAGFLQQQALYIPEIDLHTVFQILRKSMGFQICIQADSIPIRL